MLCPGCNLPVKDERTTVHSNIESMPPVDGHVNDEEEEEDSDSLFESSSRIVTYESTNNRLNNISGKLGEKLLKGWTMRAESCLDASCRGTPLMQESAGKPLLCVSCGEEYEIKDGHLYHVQAEPKSTPIQVVGTNNVNPTTPVVPVEVPASSAACSSHAIEVFPNVSAPTNSSNVWQTARVLLEKVVILNSVQLKCFNYVFPLFTETFKRLPRARKESKCSGLHRFGNLNNKTYRSLESCWFRSKLIQVWVDITLN
jgi:uncharacterized Zn finger protein (UPF0148 family)